MKSKNPKDYWNLINNKKQSTPCMDKVNHNLFYEHFQKLNSGAPEPCDFSYVQDSPAADGPLNSEITENEGKTCINLLKNGKASGCDHVVNEFLKCSRDVMCDIYGKFFNLVLSTGLLPKEWTIGVIKPIYKNKGSRLDADSYRRINLLSCTGKLFTLILNKRQFICRGEWTADGGTGWI